MSKSLPWLAVDRAGLRSIMGGRGKEFLVNELVQNAWDAEGSTEVSVTLSLSKGTIHFRIEDNSPVGFPNLEHAYTLFALSQKASNPLLRGRFNMGEKQVLAICDSAKIETTTGTVIFSASGRRVTKDATRTGTVVSGTIRGSAEDFQALLTRTKRLIVPPGIKTTLNGEVLPTREIKLTLPARLLTEIAMPTEDPVVPVVLRQTERQTTVRIYTLLPGETAWLYEMGIPVMETGDRFHYDVDQKIPLTTDREAVKPSFLKALRVVVFNGTHELLDSEDCNSRWVHDAAENCSPEAMRAYMNKRFGEKRVSYDPSDPEANKIAVSADYTVVHGPMLSSKAWQNAREAGTIQPAGKVTPSPKPFAPGAPPMVLLNQKTADMEKIHNYTIRLAKLLLDFDISVTWADDPGWFPSATYGPSGQFVFNVGRLGRHWFDLSREPIATARQRINELVIHEFGHQYCGDHLSSEYHKALCALGAKLTEVALSGKMPEFT